MGFANYSRSGSPLRLRLGHQKIPLSWIYIFDFIVRARVGWPWTKTAGARMGCRGESEVRAKRARGDLLLDAKSRQIPPKSSRHTVQQTIAQAPAGSSDIVVVSLGVRTRMNVPDHVGERRSQRPRVSEILEKKKSGSEPALPQTLS